MKKIVVFISVLLSLLLSSVCMASPYYPVDRSYDRRLMGVQGEWQSAGGDVIIIEGNYINGCKVLYVDHIAMGEGIGFTAYIIEATGVRGIRIGDHSAESDYDNSYFDDSKPHIHVNNIKYYN